VGGLAFYERLAKELPKYLKPSSKVFFEIGTGMGEKILLLFGRGRIEKDWAGHDRFFFIES
jgi:release factor glutamine methyltransferase